MLFSVLFVSSAHGYGVETHALLTKEVVSFYNSKYSSHKITDELSSYLIDGARHEDTNPRYLNHFYDPVNDRGLADGVFAGQGSKYWAQDESNQKALIYKFFTRTADTILTASQLSKVNSVYYQTNFTWQKAINLYAQGKEEEAMFALGHVIHLIEDSSVPDHTRNDAHPPFDDGGSPYENWTKRFDLKNPDSGLSGRLTGKNPYLFGDLNGYFNSMANYSNNNFYSRDSMDNFNNPNVTEYISEKETPIGYVYGIRRDEDGLYKLVLGKNQNLISWNKTNSTFSNRQLDDLVLNDYWSRLSTKAVQHGAGVLDLFFDEAEEAKTKLAREKSSRPYLGLLIDGFEGLLSGKEIVVDNINSTPLPVLAIVTEPVSTPIELATSNKQPTISPEPTPSPTLIPLEVASPGVSSGPTPSGVGETSNGTTPTIVLTPSPNPSLSPEPSPIIWPMGGISGGGSASVEPTPIPTAEISPESFGELVASSSTEVAMEDVIDVSPSPEPTPESTPEPTPTPIPEEESPSYFSAVDFYKDSDEKYYLRLSWDSYPFIPVNYGHLVSGLPVAHNWHVAVFYYSIDAPSEPDTIQWIAYNPSTPYRAWGLVAPNGFRVRYPNCMGTFSGGSALILPDGPGDCIGMATNQAAYAHLFSGLETGTIVLEAMATNFTSAVPVSGQDFITIAYYAYQPGYEPNNYGLRFVSVDPNRYYLR